MTHNYQFCSALLPTRAAWAVERISLYLVDGSGSTWTTESDASVACEIEADAELGRLSIDPCDGLGALTREELLIAIHETRVSYMDSQEGSR